MLVARARSAGDTLPHPVTCSRRLACGRCLRSPGIFHLRLTRGRTPRSSVPMPIPSLGRETPHAPPPPHPSAPQAGRRQDDDVQYLFKSVQALRGRENAAKAKWQNGGWELVSENRGTLRTELSFRRVKPKTPADHVLT